MQQRLNILNDFKEKIERYSDSLKPAINILEDHLRSKQDLEHFENQYFNIYMKKIKISEEVNLKMKSFEKSKIKRSR